MGGYLSALTKFFGRGEPRTPIDGVLDGCWPRFMNICRNNFRGILGTLVPIAATAWQFKKQSYIIVKCMWIIMGCLFILQPVNIPVIGFIPIFMLPMLGVMNSHNTCRCYMNETMLLFLISGMVLLLWNNSGLDRRVALCLLNCNAKPETYNGNQLILRVGTASFLLSILSNKLIVSSFLMEFVTKPLMDLQYATRRGEDPDYDKVRYVVCNTIQTCSSIGSIVLPHTSLAMLAALMIFLESAPPGLVYPDIFNYFQFVAFTLPIALAMLIVNLIYNMILLCKEPKMSAWGMKTLRAAMLKNKDGMPKKITCHEILTLVAKLLLLIALMTRWTRIIFTNLYVGWSVYAKEQGDDELTGIKDTTVFATFAIILHILPKGFGWTRFFRCYKITKRSQLGPIKPESAILFWRFVDKNLNYGYIYLLGSGVALVTSARDSLLGFRMAADLCPYVSKLDWKIIIGIICFVSVLLANIMTSVAACVIWLPFVLMLSLPPDSPEDWTNRTYLSMLAVGAGTTFGFCWPFLYTPAYFCHYVGKVPMKKMPRYAVGSAVLCMLILWVSLMFFAPLLWDPSGKGISMVHAPMDFGDGPVVATTPAPAPAPEPAPDAAEPAPDA